MSRVPLVCLGCKRVKPGGGCRPGTVEETLAHCADPAEFREDLKRARDWYSYEKGYLEALEAMRPEALEVTQARVQTETAHDEVARLMGTTLLVMQSKAANAAAGATVPPKPKARTRKPRPVQHIELPAEVTRELRANA